MQGNFSVFTKNLKNFAPGTVAFLSQMGKAFDTWKRIQDRKWDHAPQDVKDMLEVFEPTYQKRGICQNKNVWVDPNLSSTVSQKDIAQLLNFSTDAYRFAHATGFLFAFGGYALPIMGIFFSSDTFIPSTFNKTESEVKKWRIAQDLQRYKYAPLYICDTRWYIDYNAAPPPEVEVAWDDVYEKNDVRRIPANISKAAKLYECVLPMSSMRRRAARLLGRAMGVPTFPLWARLCMINRIKCYWELIWNEDYMVIKSKLHESMSDEELYDFAWRRYLAPYDKELTRDQVLQRVNDYFEVLGHDFIEKGHTPNIHILAAYCLGYYNDPAYLTEDISKLDENDYDDIASFGKDAYLRRLEFENGPLRDQVEAHTQRVLAARQQQEKTAV